MPARTSVRTPVAGPAAWYGRDLVRSDEWVHRFSPRDVDELVQAAERVIATGTDLARVSRGEFPLPTLGPVLDAIRQEVLRGRGFVLLRGFPVDRGREVAAVAYWGVGQYFGRPVPQNRKGHLLGHVKDLGLDPGDPNRRVYTTRERHRYHTDSCDVVGLLCLQPAREGGLSSVVSSVTLHNEMLARRPELLDLLFESFPVDRKGEIPEGKGPYYELPVCHWYAGELSIIYARDFIENSQRFPDAPRLTDGQIEAMDAFDALAADPDLHVDMQLEPGDMQFLHNHQTLHARTAYEDHPEPDRKRHLLRLWLCPPDGRRLPPGFGERYGSVTIGQRGGIVVPGMVLTVPREAD